MEKDLYNIELTKIEYSYICDSLKEIYKLTVKLPKKMRTEKFGVLENLIQTKFSGLQ